MANHKWELSGRQINDRYRQYTCARCGKGPVVKDVLSDKTITALAKKAGILPNCNEEICKNIQES